MKNTYIVILVIVVLAAIGIFFYVSQNNVVEAPVSVAPENSMTSENNASGQMPVSTEVVPPTPVAPAADESASTGVVKEFVVEGKNFSFTPSMLSVSKGDRVKITFKNTSGFHDFRIDEFGVAAKQAQSPYQEVLEFTADKTGTFEYYCSVGTHRAMGMKGTLKVE